MLAIGNILPSAITNWQRYNSGIQRVLRPQAARFICIGIQAGFFRLNSLFAVQCLAHLAEQVGSLIRLLDERHTLVEDEVGVDGV